MKNAAVHFAIALTALVACGAAEELAPKWGGTGFPALLASAAYFASKRRAAPALLYALAAGAAEDALSSLPAATSASVFAAAALCVRASRVNPILWFPLWCVFQGWLWIWLGGAAGNVFTRMLAAIPLSLATFAATAYALAWLDGKAGANED